MKSNLTSSGERGLKDSHEVNVWIEQPEDLTVKRASVSETENLSSRQSGEINVCVENPEIVAQQNPQTPVDQQSSRNVWID